MRPTNFGKCLNSPANRDGAPSTNFGGNPVNQDLATSGEGFPNRRAFSATLQKAVLLFPKVYGRSKVARSFGRVEREVFELLELFFDSREIGWNRLLFTRIRSNAKSS